MKTNRRDTVYFLGQLGGLPYNFARALETQGMRAISVAPCNADFGKLNRQLPTDTTIFSREDNALVRGVKTLRYILTELRERAQLVHFFGGTLLPRALDPAILRRENIPMAISFGGTDVRIDAIARKNNPYYLPMPYSPGEHRIRRHLRLLSRSIPCVLTDPELAEYVGTYFAHVEYIGQPIDCKLYEPKAMQSPRSEPLIVHIPTHPDFKGTPYVVDAVEKLRAAGERFAFRLVEPTLTQVQVRELFEEADIVIDEIRCGAIGLTTIEAMALGKPVIEFVREDLVGKYPAPPPVANANPQTVGQVLQELIRNAQSRIELGFRAREYVERYHSYTEVGRRLLAAYRSSGLIT